VNFLGAVNRVLVNNFILKGDDDLLTSFTESTHEATLRVAKNAIQTELNHFASEFEIPYEKTTGQVVTVASQRTYSLPLDFVRFYGDNPYLYNDSDYNDRLYEYAGGENKLRQTDLTYLTNSGVENWWYWNNTTTKSIAMYQVPNAIRTYNFEYERDISVENATDTIPLHTDAEAQAFSDMCGRRFKYIMEELNVSDLDKDADYTFNRTTLMNLMRHRNENKRYGKHYR